MRILYITDTHLTAKNPASRLDVYETVTYDKLNEIGEIIKKNNVDLVLHGGDMFHSPKVSLRYTGKIAEIIKSWGVPVIVVVGNHDLYGYNISTIDQTTLGLLNKTKVVELLYRGKYKEYDIDGLKLIIEGQHYYKDIDTCRFDDYAMSYKGDYNILATHSMLLDRPFYPGIPHTLIKDVKTDADLILAGHYHDGWKETIIDNTTFINPGSTIRVESSREDMPKVLLLDFNNVNGKIEEKHEYIYLKTARKREEVFDLKKIINKNDKISLINEFQKSIEDLSNIQSHSSSIDIVKEITSKNQVEKDVENKAIELITRAEEMSDEENDVLKGFVEKPYELRITELEIKNFQSYKHEVIKYTEGLNAIVGESGNGKTSSLRALVWCLFNEPKGSNFIRTNQNSCEVKVTFSDGSSIKRSRTRTSSGTYEVTDTNGNVEVFKGFGSEIPIEVINTHQMLNVTLAKDRKYKINVADQLHPHFLITEPVSVKASALGRLIGAQTMDIAIKQCSKDALNASKEMNFYVDLINKENEKLKEFEDLEEKKNLLKTLEMFSKEKNNIETLLTLAKNLKHKYDAIENEISDLNSKLANLDYMDSLNIKIKEYSSCLEEYIRIDKYYSMLKEARHIVNLIKLDNDKLFDITNILDNKMLVNEYKETLNSYENINNLKDDLDKVINNIKSLKSKAINQDDIDKLKDFILKINNGIDMLNTLYKYTNLVEENSKSIEIEDKSKNELETRISKGKVLIDSLKKEFKEYISKINVCPVCNQVIDAKLILDDAEVN
ncbi:calcineurin-like phosphoesterase family protein (plasmid) [Clostridium baratii str. Sullivan]|uniref:Calcineurin-like phosphoesterase family protein n=1 Tax=Clostridium baratii str. Sullivan TaxID=1415775 RepID=A0A0A7G306_9CLOT|nr:AAA family ATPase [Clostridium baratii]AIY85361.1 calcineurin-like phosphoesterase family protein [Clostridium baratii str. Sullivan]